ncbi:hypothetical protein PPYR_04233 [Photinus pyralis]|uniref:Uncharacterized protein n=2 Tax=Photinus pyralis TaxID=7054 RepID=A0A5N4AXK2_PHOPY|nr:hypothetical protein PPYR_04233 [Photinus pyralis]
MSVSICNNGPMKQETEKSEKQLRPDAPAYVPIVKNPVQAILEQFSSKEPQSSRYSRKSVRRITDPNGPRPILGTKTPFPRPILGRKEENVVENDEENIQEFVSMEFRSVSRKMQKMKVDENDPGKNNKKKNKNVS